MKRATIIAIAAVALAGAGPAWTSIASAQGYDTQQPQQKSALFSDAVIKSYVAANREVQRISQKYMPQFQAAHSPQDQEAVRQKATQKMIKAIKEKGLTVEQYNQIASAARSDPATAAKINKHSH